MIELNITKESIAEAKKLYYFGILNNSYTKGDGNKCGALGEVLVRQYYNAIQENTYDYDLIINNKKIDVKTKRHNSKLNPNSNWTMSLFAFNTKQKCDYYCFVGMADDYNKAYLYGFIEKDIICSSPFLGKLMVANAGSTVQPCGKLAFTLA